MSRKKRWWTRPWPWPDKLEARNAREPPKNLRLLKGRNAGESTGGQHGVLVLGGCRRWLQVVQRDFPGMVGETWQGGVVNFPKKLCVEGRPTIAGRKPEGTAVYSITSYYGVSMGTKDLARARVHKARTNGGIAAPLLS
jgi:hypothetical protein